MMAIETIKQIVEELQLSGIDFLGNRNQPQESCTDEHKRAYIALTGKVMAGKKKIESEVIPLVQQVFNNYEGRKIGNKTILEIQAELIHLTGAKVATVHKPVNKISFVFWELAGAPSVGVTVNCPVPFIDDKGRICNLENWKVEAYHFPTDWEKWADEVIEAQRKVDAIWGGIAFGNEVKNMRFKL